MWRGVSCRGVPNLECEGSDGMAGPRAMTPHVSSASCPRRGAARIVAAPECRSWPLDQRPKRPKGGSEMVSTWR